MNKSGGGGVPAPSRAQQRKIYIKQSIFLPDDWYDLTFFPTFSIRNSLQKLTSLILWIFRSSYVKHNIVINFCPYLYRKTIDYNSA